MAKKEKVQKEKRQLNEDWAEIVSRIYATVVQVLSVGMLVIIVGSKADKVGNILAFGLAILAANNIVWLGDKLLFKKK